MKSLIKQERGFSLLELMIAGLILLIVGLFVSSIFIRGSIEMTSNWQETVATTIANNLLDEIKGIAHTHEHSSYKYILMTADNDQPATVNTTHLHIDISSFILGSKTTSFKVVAHTDQHQLDDENHTQGLTVSWTTPASSESWYATPTFTSKINLNSGQGTGWIIFPDPPLKYRGDLTVSGAAWTITRRLMVYPSKGEAIARSDIPGTVTRRADFELVHDSESSNPNSLDYMKGTITVNWGQPVHQRELVAIIAPWPE